MQSLFFTVLFSTKKWTDNARWETDTAMNFMQAVV
jgi:hypothetical protein